MTAAVLEGVMEALHSQHPRDAPRIADAILDCHGEGWLPLWDSLAGSSRPCTLPPAVRNAIGRFIRPARRVRCTRVPDASQYGSPLSSGASSAPSDDGSGLDGPLRFSSRQAAKKSKQQTQGSREGLT